MNIIRHDARRAVAEVVKHSEEISQEEICQSYVAELAEMQAKLKLYKAELEANADVFDNHGMTVNASQTRCFLVRTSCV